MALITVLILLFLLIINWFLYRQWVSPAIITTTLWLFLSIIYNLTDHGLYALSDKFYLIVILWNLGFSISCYLSGKLKIIAPQASVSLEKENTWKFFLPLICISLLITIYGRIQIGLAYNSSNILAGIYAHSVTSLSGGISPIQLPFYYSIAQEFSTYSLVIIGSLMYFHDKKDYKLIFILLLFIIFTILRSNKFSICQCLFYFITLRVLTKGISKKTLLLFGGIFIFFIVGTQVLRRSDGDSTINLINMISVYFLSPLPAFDYVINAPINLIEDFNGEYTFRAFIPYINLLGYNLVGNSDPFNLNFWTYTPLHVNVYTVFFSFYVDFGLPGIIGASLIYGAFFGYLWKGCSKRIPMFMVAYASMSYILFFQFFADFLISYFWANFLPLCFIYLYFTHFKLNIRKYSLAQL